MTDDGIKREAIFSACGEYRYWLKRSWDDSKPIAICVGLNPSTANHETDDRTISKLIEIMKFQNYGGFIMTNLYAVISSTTDILYSTPDPLKDNDKVLREVFQHHVDIFYCWGAFPKLETRIRAIRNIAAYYRMNEKCFGKTKHGAPIHPAYYVRRGTKPENIMIQSI